MSSDHIHYPHLAAFALTRCLLVSGELIVSKYVAESITMIVGRFGHEGLCQLLTKAFVAETSCFCLNKMP